MRLKYSHLIWTLINDTDISYLGEGWAEVRTLTRGRTVVLEDPLPTRQADPVPYCHPLPIVGLHHAHLQVQGKFSPATAAAYGRLPGVLEA